MPPQVRDYFSKLIHQSRRQIETFESGVARLFEQTIEKPYWTDVTDRAIDREKAQIAELERILAQS